MRKRRRRVWCKRDVKDDDDESNGRFYLNKVYIYIYSL